ncbi:XRE family transcriptional regulator [Paraburkholderia sp. IW21]|uniref:XRE family transcriptional regulator n=1 Tax=Paraburkholderia sp. IW21 TaxID=3242488 RepID=UPI0035208CF0
MIRWARGKSTQAEFAAAHGVNKSSLSRFEAEKAGAPTHLINDCLSQLADFLMANPGATDGIKGALDNARKTVTLLEGLAGGDA